MLREDLELLRDALIRAAVKQWFSVKEGAVYLGISTSKLYKLAEAGRVRHHLIDSKIVFSRADLDSIPKRPKVDLDAVMEDAVVRLRKRRKEL